AVGRGADPLVGLSDPLEVDRAIGEAPLDLRQRLVALRADRGQDHPNRFAHLVESRLQGADPHRQVAGIPPVPVEALDLHGFSGRSRSTRSSTSAARNLWEMRLATRRAVEPAISSRISRPFSSSVRPVATRSTIPSARPARGASSTDPLTSITSAWRPVSSKYRSAMCGYLVAIRIPPTPRSDSPMLSSPLRPPTTKRHAPAAKSK